MPTHLNKPNLNKTASFSKSSRFDQSLMQVATPGPGAYQESQVIGRDPIGSPTKKGFTMRPKTNIKNKQIPTPGPGSYGVGIDQLLGTKNTVHSSPSKTISQRTMTLNKSTSLLINPGPGQYENQPTKVNPSAPSYTMRPKTEPPKGFTHVPGPGNYEHGTSIGKGASKTMSKRHVFMDREKKPGPGNYEPRLAGSRSAPAFTMRAKTSSKQTRDLNYTPGPGSYQTRHFIGKEHAKGKTISLRNTLSDRGLMSQTPGPGNYSPKRQNFSKSSSLHGAGVRKDRKIEDYPGPGTYQNEVNGNDRSNSVLKPQAASYTMRKKTSTLYEGKKIAPGPDHYEIKQHNFTKKTAPSYSMRVKHRDTNRDMTPGPGAHSPKQKTIKKKAPSYSMRAREKTQSFKHMSTPGPKYYPTSAGKPKASSYSMTGRSNYSSLDAKHNSPGPGAHDPYKYSDF